MRIFSIFKSINGEVTYTHQGSVCTFVRLVGCNLNCSWCDTKYAMQGGCEKKIPEIIDQINKTGSRNVTITGGEPLIQQPELHKLVVELYKRGYKVAIETNGSIAIPDWKEVTCWVADWKLSGSGESKSMKVHNFRNLVSDDFVKFVVTNKKDFDESLDVQEKLYTLGVTFAYSPCHPLPPQKLLDWMMKSNLNRSILNIQLHKILDLEEDKATIGKKN